MEAEQTPDKASTAAAVAQSAALIPPNPNLPSLATALAACIAQPLRAHCVARLAHRDGAHGVNALAVVEGVGLVSGGEQFVCSWALGADRGLRSTVGRALQIAALPGGRFAAVGDDPSLGETRVFAGNSLYKLLEVWDAGAGGGGQRLHQLRGHTFGGLCVAALPGGLFASGGLDNLVHIWSAATGARVATLEGHGGAVHALTALPDGRLASGGGILDNAIRVWSVATRACTQVLEHPAVLSVRALAALHCGRLAASGSLLTHSIHIWSLAGGGVVEAELTGHTGHVESLEVLPSGLLASGGDDKTVRVWDVGARACAAVLEGHGGPVCALAALPGGRLASGARGDPLVRVWALAAPGSPEDAAAEAAAARGVEGVAPGPPSPPPPAPPVAELAHGGAGSD